MKTVNHFKHTRETREIMRKIQILKLSQKRLRHKWHDYDVKILALKHQIINKLELIRW